LKVVSKIFSKSYKVKIFLKVKFALFLLRHLLATRSIKILSGFFLSLLLPVGNFILSLP